MNTIGNTKNHIVFDLFAVIYQKKYWWANLIQF